MMVNSGSTIEFLFFFLTCSYARETTFTKFSVQKFPNKEVSHADRVKVYSCLLECQRDRTCKSSQLDEEGNCVTFSEHQALTSTQDKVFAVNKDIGIINDCASVGKNGVYSLNLSNPTDVYCEVAAEGNWLVFQRRQDGSVDFFRDWAAYKTGFGKLEGEFWLGNDILHELTKDGFWELRVDMEDQEGVKMNVRYDVFQVGDESTNYRLRLSKFQGGNPPGNAFWSNQEINGRPFATYDRDSGNCAKVCLGGWWYNKCHNANPNGLYDLSSTDSTAFQKTIVWRTWQDNCLKRISLAIRK